MISVVMATYNGAMFIEKQMESIRKQTLLPDEVLFCDDNSTDNTVIIIESYIRKYKLNNWKIIINKINLGYYMNFMKGIRLAKGDTIYFADQDDIWNMRKIETSENAFSRNRNIMMVQTNYIFINQYDNKLPMHSNYHRISTRKEMLELSLDDICKFAGSGFTMGFRRKVVSYIYDEKLYQIKEFNFHDILVGLSAACLGECLYLPNIYDEHRLHFNNATQKVNESVIAKRTKSVQIGNFENRKKYFIIMKKLLVNDKNKSNLSKKINTLNKFINFNDIRINYYNTRKIKYFIKLLRNIKCYYNKKAIFADILFAFNADMLIKKFLKDNI